jgi:ABC-type amino acid transport system permease subunit
LPRDIGKPLLVGLAVAALISTIVPDDFFAGRLGQGLPAMLVMMAIYGTLSLLTSLFMNWYNNRVKLVER